VRDYLEAAKANGRSTATLKQHVAAVCMLFDVRPVAGRDAASWLPIFAANSPGVR
jgi:hypothetical protein